MPKNQNLKFNLNESQIIKYFFIDSKKYIYQITFHLIVSIILFSPLFFGKFQMAGTDQYFNIFPDIFFGLRDYKDFGHFNFWNPYIFSGFDMTESMHSHFLHPVFWPTLFFNEKYVFHIITIIFFLFNFGLAFFWIKISNFFNLNKIFSSIVALTAQASFFFWFATINFIGVHLFFFSTYIIYLLCTNKSKNYLLNFALLSLSFAMIFITSHPGYVFGFSLVPFLFALFLYKENFLNKKYFIIFFIAILLALLASLHRIVPIYLMLEDGTGGNAMQWNRGFTSASYLILTLFNPSMFGNVLGDSLYFFETMNYPRGIHNAFHTSLYFGIGPLIIILSSLFFKMSKPKVLMFIFFLLMLFQSTYFFEGTYDFINILFKPFNHSSIFKILSFYSFIFLLIFSLKDFSEKNLLKKKINLEFIGSIFFIFFIFSLGIYLDVINYLYIKEFQQFYKLSEIIKVIDVNVYFLFLKFVIIFGFFYFIFFKTKLNFDKIQNLFKIIFLSVFFIFLVSTLIGIFAHKYGIIFVGAESYLTFIKNFLILILSLYFIYIFIEKKIKIKKLILFFIFCFLVSFNIGEKFTASNIILSVHMSVLGWLGFFCIFTIYLIIFKKLKNKIISYNSFILIFLVIHFIDLTVSFKNNSFVNIWKTPFIKNIQKIYPIESGKNNIGIDEELYQDIIKNYKFNNISFIDNYTDGHELQASFGILSKKKSYAGVDSVFPNDYYKFLEYFLDEDEKNKLSRAGIVGDIKNERLLDILGVKVDIDNNKDIKIRPNAIPRISAFNNYIITDNSDFVLKKLKDNNFDISKNVLIKINKESNLQDSKTFNLKNKKYKKMNYNLVNNDNISIDLKQDEGRAILFNDRYSENWNAYWNDKKIPIYTANGVFMAVVIPEGNGTLNFRFEPKLFITLFNISNYVLFSIVFFIVISLGRIFFEKRKIKFW